jgi:hypothetical protein
MQTQGSTIPPIDELISLYEQNVPMNKLAARFGVSEGTIRNRLKAAGCKLRPRGSVKGRPSHNKRELPQGEWEVIIREYAELISGETIAEQHKVSPGVIYRGLAERGIELRERTAHMRNLHADRKQKVAFAQQFPPDWWNDDKADWRPIGSELLSRKGYMSNEELADRLNASRIIRCPFCKDGDWGCITRTGPAMNFITKVRRWVNRSGRAALRN